MRGMRIHVRHLMNLMLSFAVVASALVMVGWHRLSMNFVRSIRQDSKLLSLSTNRFFEGEEVTLSDFGCPADDRTIEDDVAYYLGDLGTRPSPPQLSRADSWQALKSLGIDAPVCVDVSGVASSMRSMPLVERRAKELVLDARYMYAKELVSLGAEGSALGVRFGDSLSETGVPSLLAKIRPCSKKDGGVIYKAEAWRHWDPDVFKEVLAFDGGTPWGQKRDVAVWRGATTGHPYPTKAYANLADDPLSGTYHSRAELVRRIPAFSNIPHLDVAVSAYVQGVENLWGLGSFQSRLAQAGNKMIIIAEGNDVATGSKW